MISCSLLFHVYAELQTQIKCPFIFISFVYVELLTCISQKLHSQKINHLFMPLGIW